MFLILLGDSKYLGDSKLKSILGGLQLYSSQDTCTLIFFLMLILALEKKKILLLEAMSFRRRLPRLDIYLFIYLFYLD